MIVVMMVAIGCWYAVHRKWVMDRQFVLQNEVYPDYCSDQSGYWRVLFGQVDHPPPIGVRLLGDWGVATITVRTSNDPKVDQDRAERYKRLFPEAAISIRRSVFQEPTQEPAS